eukprot:scaffold24005_cov29-Tisochrysis_lutea.AAC.1
MACRSRRRSSRSSAPLRAARQLAKWPVGSWGGGGTIRPLDGPPSRAARPGSTGSEDEAFIAAVASAIYGLTVRDSERFTGKRKTTKQSRKASPRDAGREAGGRGGERESTGTDSCLNARQLDCQRERERGECRREEGRGVRGVRLGGSRAREREEREGSREPTHARRVKRRRRSSLLLGSPA